MVRGNPPTLQAVGNPLAVGLNGETKVTLSLKVVVRSRKRHWVADLMDEEDQYVGVN